MDPISRMNSLITESFNSVKESQSEVLETLATTTRKVFKEITQTTPNWRQKLSEIGNDATCANYVGHVVSNKHTPAELLQSQATDDFVLNELQVTAFVVYEMVERGCPEPTQLKDLNTAIQNVTLKSLNSLRKLLRRHNYDIDYLSDRVQEAALETIRAARCYKHTGIASFDTYASARVKTVVSRKELHHTLMVKVSDRDISGAYSKAIEINSEKTNNKLTPDSSASSYLPKPLYDFEQGSNDNRYGVTSGCNDNVVSDLTHLKLRQHLIAQLKTLNANEKIVIMNEMGLVAGTLNRNDLVESLGFSSSRYTQVKTSALQKLGAHKSLSKSWERALA
ncbi:hypothetical protein AB4552_02210 [Vibrio sp. 10N.222.54.C3]|uniref:hypothetical protein n=1 Tax=Vibrio sp. 10N.222.54.C3 TaxID=3229640 RepID=UPI0035518F84